MVNLVSSNYLGLMRWAQNNHFTKKQSPTILLEAQNKLRNLHFLVWEAQRNFRNKLFNLVDSQRTQFSNYCGTKFKYQVKAQSNFCNYVCKRQCKLHIFVILGRKK